MEDKKLLKDTELEKVNGGTGESNQYAAAIEVAIADIKIEINMLNDGTARNSGSSKNRNRMLQIYSDMLSNFSSLHAILNPTIDDIEQIFSYNYEMSLTGRPKEIFDKFKNSVQWL